MTTQRLPLSNVSNSRRGTREPAIVCFSTALNTTTHLLYGCETWTLFVDFKKRIPDFETRCPRKLLRISHLEHKTNDWMRNKINFLVGLQEPPPATVKRLRLAWKGHATRHDNLPKTILLRTLGGGRAGWTTSKSGHPCPCQNCSQKPHAEKTGKGSLLNRP